MVKITNSKMDYLPTELQNEYTGCGLILVEYMYIAILAIYLFTIIKILDYYIQHMKISCK